MSTGRVSGVGTSLLPRTSTPPVFDHLQYAKTTDLWHDHHMSSCLISTVKTCTRPTLHSVLVSMMGQVPTESYTECKKHAQVSSHDSKWLPSDKHENAQCSSYMWDMLGM